MPSNRECSSHTEEEERDDERPKVPLARATMSVTRAIGGLVASAFREQGLAVAAVGERWTASLKASPWSAGPRRRVCKRQWRHCRRARPKPPCGCRVWTGCPLERAYPLSHVALRCLSDRRRRAHDGPLPPHGAPSQGDWSWPTARRTADAPVDGADGDGSHRAASTSSPLTSCTRRTAHARPKRCPRGRLARGRRRGAGPSRNVRARFFIGEKARSRGGALRPRWRRRASRSTASCSSVTRFTLQPSKKPRSITSLAFPAPVMLCRLARRVRNASGAPTIRRRARARLIRSSRW